MLPDLSSTKIMSLFFPHFQSRKILNEKILLKLKKNLKVAPLKVNLQSVMAALLLSVTDEGRYKRSTKRSN